MILHQLEILLIILPNSHKATSDLSFKQDKFVPDLIPRPEKMVIPYIFTGDIHVGPSKISLGLSSTLQWLSNVFHMVLYISCMLYVYCFNIQHYAHYILHKL